MARGCCRIPRWHGGSRRGWRRRGRWVCTGKGAPARPVGSAGGGGGRRARLGEGPWPLPFPDRVGVCAWWGLVLPAHCTISHDAGRSIETGRGESRALGFFGSLRCGRPRGRGGNRDRSCLSYIRVVFGSRAPHIAGAMRYVELRAHTAFSFGDGATTPEALVRRAAEYGYPALGLTDHADLGGVIRFALECERSGGRPVVGAELVVDGHPLAVLAMDERGYRNLAALVTRSRVGALRVEEVEGVEAIRPRGRPSLSFAELEARSEGLFVLTGPASGEIASLVRAGRPEEAAYVLDRWRSVFPGRLAVEVQLHRGSGAGAALAAALIELAARARVPWVVTNDPRYLDAGGRLVHDLLTALRAGLDVNTAASWGVLHPNGEWRLKTPEEMARLWKGREARSEERRVG